MDYQNTAESMNAQQPIRIGVVDDHAMLRQGLAFFLMSYHDLTFVGEAANGKEALTLCAETRPDIILMDLVMPVMDGIMATRLIRQEYPQIQVIALTSFGEERLIKDVLAAGAISYLFKKVSADDLATAIRAAHQGVSTFAPEVTDILIRSARHPESVFEQLTRREREVLALMVKGKSNSEIATLLVIGLSTTKSHVGNVLNKLGVTSRSEAIVMVLEHNLNIGDFYVK